MRLGFSIRAGLFLWCGFWVLLAEGSLPGQSEELVGKSQRAKQAMSTGRFEEAATLYAELVRALPGNLGLVMNLGLALHSAGQYRKALDQFQAVVKRQPDFGAAWLMLGLAHLKLGEPARAIEPLRKALELEPGNKIARLELADALLSVGRPEEAGVHFRKLAEVDPGHPKAWQGLGLSYAALARRSFAELEKLAPDSAYWYALLARSQAEQQQYRSAFHFYRQALGKMPDLRGLHAALAEIYRQTGHPDWVAVEQEKESRLPPPNCLTQALECSFLAGRYAEVVTAANKSRTPESFYWQTRAYGELAREAFARLSQLPATAEIHELLAVAYRLQGLHHQSVKEWEEALKLVRADSGDSRRLRQELARSLWLAREHQAARPLLEELLKQDPESAELNYQLGDTLAELRDAESAVGYLMKAVKARPGFLPARAALGRAYLRAGRPKQAIPHLQAAQAADEDGSLLYQLARAYRETGQPALAQEAMRKFEEISASTQARRQRLTEDYQITPP